MKPKRVYQPKPEEQAALDRVRARARRTQGRLKISTKEGVSAISTDHKDNRTGLSLQMDALGISSFDSLNWFLKSLINAISSGKAHTETEINGALGFIKAMQPRDDLEALLLAQMMAT